ncbi:MAG: hypothetical protein ABIZ34_06370, partial [Candidatus Limnocylindrales bacterium]
MPLAPVAPVVDMAPVAVPIAPLVPVASIALPVSVPASVPAYPAVPVTALPVPSVGQPQPMLSPTDQALVAVSSGHLRRCVYRRVAIDAPARARRTDAPYAVECRHPSLESPVALGDLHDARPICNACVLPGKFRADE